MGESYVYCGNFNSGAVGETRTPKGLSLLRPERSASTNFATTALIYLPACLVVSFAVLLGFRHFGINTTNLNYYNCKNCIIK